MQASRTTAKASTRRFVLLDRDGVINRRVAEGYVTSWSEFEFLPGAIEGLRLFAAHGYTVLVVSNQACVGKGLLRASELVTLTERFLMEVALAGGRIERVYYCSHREDERCSCRKPRPGLLLRAQADHGFIPAQTYFVGDSPSDWAAATAAGCPSIAIRRGAFLREPEDCPPNKALASDLAEAAQFIVESQSSLSALEERLA